MSLAYIESGEIFKTFVKKPYSPKIKLSEEQLIAGIRAGDEYMMTYLYDNYSAPLFGIILRIVKVNEIAEDVLQDTFVKIWRMFGNFDPAKGRLFTWLAVTAKNTAIDQMRSKYHRNTKADESIDDHGAKVDLFHRVNNNPDTIGIKDLSKKLKDKYCSIIDLVYFQGYSHTEAAEQLCIPVGTVKTRIRVSMKILKAAFDLSA